MTTYTDAEIMGGAIAEAIGLLTSCMDLQMADMAVQEAARFLIHAKRRTGRTEPSWFRSTKEQMYWREPLPRLGDDDDWDYG